jgi:hypothetical protein
MFYFNSSNSNINTILVGNGINRIVANGPSWIQLLNDLSLYAGHSPNTESNDYKPLPLYLEEIVLRNQGDYLSTLKDTKKEIKKILTKLMPNELHYKLLNSKVQNILTTNYDYALEKTFEKDYINESPTTEQTAETKHSLKRKKDFPGNKTIWHIHGEINQVKGLNNKRGDYAENSIMIGYEHYSEYATEIYNFTKGYKKYSDESILSKIIKGTDNNKSWVDFFFNSNLIIFGFELNFAEHHIWWLLNYRAIEKKKEMALGNNIIKNNITYVYPELAPLDYSVAKSDEIANYQLKQKQKQARSELLESMGVLIEPIRLNNDNYLEFYLKVIDKYCK